MGALVSLGLSLVQKFWKYLVVALAVAYVCYLGYHWYSGVKAEAYSSGFTAGQADKQKVIDAMLTQQSKDNQALNDKIAGLEAQSRTAAASEFALRAQLVTARGTIVTKYVQANPQSSQSCGFDAPAVRAINDSIKADPSIVDTGN